MRVLRGGRAEREEVDNHVATKAEEGAREREESCATKFKGYDPRCNLISSFPSLVLFYSIFYFIFLFFLS